MGQAGAPRRCFCSASCTTSGRTANEDTATVTGPRQDYEGDFDRQCFPDLDPEILTPPLGITEILTSNHRPKYRQNIHISIFIPSTNPFPSFAFSWIRVAV